jgi:hypothetical protein
MAEERGPQGINAFNHTVKTAREAVEQRHRIEDMIAATATDTNPQVRLDIVPIPFRIIVHCTCDMRPHASLLNPRASDLKMLPSLSRHLQQC